MGEAQKDRADDSKWVRLLLPVRTCDDDDSSGPDSDRERSSPQPYSEEPSGSDDSDDEKEEEEEGQNEEDKILEEDAEDEEEMRAEMQLLSPVLTATLPPQQRRRRDQRLLLPAHAVFFRQQLDGWRLQSVQREDDALRVKISPMDAWLVYGYSRSRAYHIPEVTGLHRHISSLLLIDVVTWLLRSEATFAEYDPTRQKRAKARKREERRMAEMLEGDDYKRYQVQAAHALLATQRWMRSSAGSPVLLRLPAEVVVHSVLAFLDFEPLMDLRSVSRAFKELVELAAVQWCNRRFSKGPKTMQRQQQAERQRREVEQTDEKEQGEKASKVTGKRKRSSEWVQVSTGPVAFASTSLPSTSPATTAAVCAVSYTPADAVWVRQQLLWARRLDHQQREWRREPLVSKSEALDRFPLNPIDWSRWFGESLLVLDGYEERYGIARSTAMEVVELVLELYSIDLCRLQTSRAAAAAPVRTRERPKLVDRASAVEAVAAAAGLTVRWKELGEMVLVGGIPMRWRSGSWEALDWFVNDSREGRIRNSHGPTARSVHRAMRRAGFGCGGRCWWGNCYDRS